ncbi:MAG: hypothetical protein II257_05710, partial [Clostridia bacterium]|nr:hypothetical protein [Clostridia bacterium]
HLQASGTRFALYVFKRRCVPDAGAVLGIVLYFKEKILKPLRKDGYLNRCNVPKKHFLRSAFSFHYGELYYQVQHINKKIEVHTNLW